MPENTLKQWMNLLIASVPKSEISKILDLGCGTGRFSFALSESFKCSLFAVDPSAKMLREAHRDQKEKKDITWLKGIAEDIPIEDDSMDLIWMSQIFHHIDNIDLAFKEIVRVLNKDGFLAVRNGMVDHIDEIIWYDCFPEAAEIERNRMLSQEETVAQIIKYDFRLCTAIRLYQYFARNYDEYVEKISGRGLSSLIAINDEDFNNGVQRLKLWAKSRQQNEPVFEPVDLLVFQKG